ncbi:MAG TPA: nitric oxide reductase D protein [Paracoccus sp. (in: a-proteobacteria)]|uniref:nitric oxide reductase activation protein NorD n=1 Tax=uncultured Paracoccus sp. TaxID=189685 RepID=UPI00261A37F0|nr:nitric oxide reductase D protein [uncultured Paracoccus sp.]HMQ41011.1 nitric oxide reductase D protein [Paracoccus sp. (in: a-proteobacteria)]HMR37021.1 nitric oxide reductase D protein [Paracoccus sp. (in: a-proteobacteria)]
MATEWREIEPWEPEESVGKLWHAFASRLDAPSEYPEARVALNEVSGRIQVLFRGLGGSPSVELRPAAKRVSQHRIGWRRKLGTDAEALPRASFDGEALRLPETLAIFPRRDANEALYLWLAASAAHAPPTAAEDDPLRADLARLQAARQMVAATLDDAPGLKRLYAGLAAAVLAQRPVARLRGDEAAVEELVRQQLGDGASLSERAQALLQALDRGFDDLRAPRDYKPFRPVVIWPEIEPVAKSVGQVALAPDTKGAPQDAPLAPKVIRARRRETDQARRNDSLILHRFEALLSWAEFLNLNRMVEDDDEDDAKKAADDQEELGLGQISKAPATRLKLHLDLAPEDADREALAGAFTYPEWDARRGSYMADHVRVLATRAEEAEALPLQDDPAARARIRAVRRQFEALRPGRLVTTGHRDGEDLDDDLAVRSRVEIRATGQGTDRIWRQSRPVARNLAVSILLDVSRSTESAVTGRAVIDIEREALTALAWGLDACGDDFAIQAFSSLRRDRVFVSDCKDFDEPMGAAVERRLASLKPQFYTRLGAGIRHASAGLARQARKRRLLLIITDGKPNDLDHYEGRHGIEDSARAVREARRAGQAVFGITVDRDGKSWFPRIFGQGGYALIPEPDKLTHALPQIYRQLVGS